MLTFPLRYIGAALAEIKVEAGGDRISAANDFDWAIALEPSKRFLYSKSKEEYGLDKEESK